MQVWLAVQHVAGPQTIVVPERLKGLYVPAPSHSQIHSSKEIRCIVHVLMHAWCFLLQIFMALSILKPDLSVAEFELLPLLAHMSAFST